MIPILQNYFHVGSWNQVMHYTSIAEAIAFQSQVQGSKLNPCFEITFRKKSTPRWFFRVQASRKSYTRNMIISASSCCSKQ